MRAEPVERNVALCPGKTGCGVRRLETCTVYNRGMEPNNQAFTDYSDGRKLLEATLASRNQFLRDLEILARIPQRRTGVVVKFETVKAQTILYRLSEIEESMEALIRQVNIYAEMTGQPRVEVTRPDAG